MSETLTATILRVICGLDPFIINSNNVLCFPSLTRGLAMSLSGIHTHTHTHTHTQSASCQYERFCDHLRDIRPVVDNRPLTLALRVGWFQMSRVVVVVT